MTKPAKKTIRKSVAVKKQAPAKQATVAKKQPVAKKTAAVKKTVDVVRVAKPVAVATPEPVPAKKTPSPRPLVAKVRARRNVVLPFRERLEEAMHRELNHDGPVCHACRMNGSRLAALAAMPRQAAG